MSLAAVVAQRLCQGLQRSPGDRRLVSPAAELLMDVRLDSIASALCSRRVSECINLPVILHKTDRGKLLVDRQIK